jgi:hypothetical protein
VGGEQLSRREFVLGASGALAGGLALLAPGPADAAVRRAKLVLTPALSYSFESVHISSVNGSWRVQLRTSAIAVQQQIQAAYQTFVGGVPALVPATLIVYDSLGKARAKYRLTHGFPAAVTVDGVTAGGVQVLESRLIWAAQTLRRVA